MQLAVSTAADGRTWSELSGGLDSSTIACVAKHLGIADFETVSIVYPKSTTSDERRWIEIATNEKRIRGHLIDGDQHRPFSLLPDRRIEEPSRLHLTWPVFREYETLLRAHGVNVLLSGFGGDQILFGETSYPLHVADHVRRLRLVAAFREVAQWQPDAAERSLGHRVVTTAMIPALSFLRGHPIRYERDGIGRPGCGWISPGLTAQSGAGQGPVRAPGPRMPTVRGQAYYEGIWRMACVAGQSWAPNTTAFQWRHPLLYRPLVEFMYALPWQQQVFAGQDRTLQRRALTGILPEQIRKRQTKDGPAQAIWEGLRTNPDVCDLLTSRPLIAERGYVDEKAWRAAVRAAQFGHVQSAPAFQAAVSLEIWLRQQEKWL
jgi:asparagine synthase (glutamine-hydrolysing)